MAPAKSGGFPLVMAALAAAALVQAMQLVALNVFAEAHALGPGRGGAVSCAPAGHAGNCPFVGNFTDRWDRRTTLLVSNVAAGLVVLVLPFLPGGGRPVCRRRRRRGPGWSLPLGLWLVLSPDGAHRGADPRQCCARRAAVWSAGGRLGFGRCASHPGAPGHGPGGERGPFGGVGSAAVGAAPQSRGGRRQRHPRAVAAGSWVGVAVFSRAAYRGGGDGALQPGHGVWRGGRRPRGGVGAPGAPHDRVHVCRLG